VFLRSFLGARRHHDGPEPPYLTVFDSASSQSRPPITKSELMDVVLGDAALTESSLTRVAALLRWRSKTIPRATLY
jgi:hypothetical protein